MNQHEQEKDCTDQLLECTTECDPQDKECEEECVEDYKGCETMVHVDKGEIISLVGASGAGKTTLLQILGTIDKYDKKEGSKLLLKNQDISDFTENQLANFRNHELGFIFQFHQLLPEFNVI